MSRATGAISASRAHRDGAGAGPAGRRAGARPSANQPSGPGRHRAEGGGVRGHALLHVARGVDLVVHRHHDAEAARGRVHGEAHAVQQVRRPVRSGERRVAHRAGQHHRGIQRENAVEHEGRFLHRVGAVGDHRAVGAAGHRLLDGVGECEQVGDRDLRARQQAKGLGFDGRRPRQAAATASTSASAPSEGETPRSPRAGHGDGPAHGEDRDRGEHGVRLSRAARVSDQARQEELAGRPNMTFS